MRSKTISLVLVFAMLTILLSATVSRVQAQQGPAIEKVRLLTIKSPDAQLIAMRTGQIDYLQGMIRPADIEALSSEGFLVTSTPGFHMGFVGFNLMRPYLDDVALKHALFHAYNQEEIVASIYRYTVTPVQSLVPPSQGEWVNPALPKHPFNPGTHLDAPGTMSTFGIMYAAGYTYVGTGYGDTNAHWEDSEGNPLPNWVFWTPTYEVAPTSAEHGARIADEWHRCGFNNIAHEPADFNTYTARVFDDHDFDIFMIFWQLGRFPLQIYAMAHSSEYVEGSDHAVGLNDPILDGLLETVKYSLDHEAAVAAAWEAEARLYDEQFEQALPYMLLYSRVYFDGSAKQLDGLVNSPGYGSDNIWTWMSWHWNTPDGLRPGTGDSLVVYCNGEEPSTLNPLASTSVYENNIIAPQFDAGILVNPYTHGDVVWGYTEFPTLDGPITETTPNGVYIENGMSVEFHLRDDIYWQDGNKFDADDALFSLNFLKDNAIPQYITIWQDIEDTYKVDQLTFKVWANNTSPFHVYNWDGGAFQLPPQVWGFLDGEPLQTILGFSPNLETTPTGPWFGVGNGPTTHLFGTGPYVFESYDPSGMYADLHGWDADGTSPGYYMSTAQIAGAMTDMFHSCGDVDRDGWIWAGDKHDYGLSFGKVAGDTGYDPNADLNGDELVDWEDGAIIGAFWAKKKQYTIP